MTNNQSDLLIELIKEAERIREDTEHSAKGHFEAARIWEKCNKWLGVPATILAASAGVSAIAEYGAVLQDSDICFGCGYCTWVCPYNAPQLDHSKGHVSKCNMCVDRLEIGLKPACVSACLAGALDFGIMETTPANRDSLETSIPGFPLTDITHPNIRFQQKNKLPDEMSRTDSIPVRYKKNAQGKFEPHVAERSAGQ